MKAKVEVGRDGCVEEVVDCGAGDGEAVDEEDEGGRREVVI
jgi:hypothetical protein